MAEGGERPGSSDPRGGRRGPGRVLVVVLAAIGVLVVASLVLVLSRGGPEPMDPASPEGVVQRYSQALIDGDMASAESLLTDRLREVCRSSSGYSTSPEYIESLRIELLSTAVREERATVRVAVVQTSPGGPFGPSEYSTESSFQLVRADGGWRIDTAPPMLQVCQGKVIAP